MSQRPGKPPSLIVHKDVTEASIIDFIEHEALQSAFVVVDLEGTANMMAGYAISRADLVIIPTQGSHLDAAESAKAMKLVQQQEKAFGKKIPFAILFTRTNASGRARCRTSRSIRRQAHAGVQRPDHGAGGLTAPSSPSAAPCPDWTPPR